MKKLLLILLCLPFIGFGQNNFSFEQLKKINGVQECVCFANGEKITAFVYSQILSETDEIFKKAAEFLPNHMLPSRIVLGKQIPINKNGKIDRARIKHEFTG